MFFLWSTFTITPSGGVAECCSSTYASSLRWCATAASNPSLALATTASALSRSASRTSSATASSLDSVSVILTMSIGVPVFDTRMTLRFMTASYVQLPVPNPLIQPSAQSAGSLGSSSYGRITSRNSFTA